MAELWIPHLDNSTNFYNTMTFAQSRLDATPSTYRHRLGKRFTDMFSQRIAESQDTEILLITDMMFMSAPRKIAVTEAIGVVGCLTSVSYGEIAGKPETHLSLDIDATHVFAPDDPTRKTPYEANVLAPLSHVHYIEHEPSAWLQD